MKFKLIIDPQKQEEVVVTAHAPSELTDQIAALVASYDRLVGYREDELVMLEPTQLACIITEDGKTYAVDVKNQRYRLKLRLHEIEERLPGYFLRINKSAIANERHILRFHAGFSGAVDAVFRGGYTEYVSRRCFAAIKRRYGK